MKKFLAMLLALVMVLSLAACGGKKTEEPAKTEEPTQTEEPAANPAADVKVGLICVHDENSGYDAAHIDGLKTACAALGISDSQIVMKYNIRGRDLL